MEHVPPKQRETRLQGPVRRQITLGIEQRKCHDHIGERAARQRQQHGDLPAGLQDARNGRQPALARIALGQLDQLAHVVRQIQERIELKPIGGAALTQGQIAKQRVIAFARLEMDILERPRAAPPRRRRPVDEQRVRVRQVLLFDRSTTIENRQVQLAAVRELPIGLLVQLGRVEKARLGESPRPLLLENRRQEEVPRRHDQHLRPPRRADYEPGLVVKRKRVLMIREIGVQHRRRAQIERRQHEVDYLFAGLVAIFGAVVFLAWAALVDGQGLLLHMSQLAVDEHIQPQDDAVAQRERRRAIIADAHLHLQPLPVFILGVEVPRVAHGIEADDADVVRARLAGHVIAEIEIPERFFVASET